MAMIANSKTFFFQQAMNFFLIFLVLCTIYNHRIDGHEYDAHSSQYDMDYWNDAHSQYDGQYDKQYGVDYWKNGHSQYESNCWYDVYNADCQWYDADCQR